MSTPQLSPEFLRTLIIVTGFRGEDIDRACAFLLLLSLKVGPIDAGMMPAEICGESKTLAGCATASLLTQKLLEPIGRVRSSSPLANGRKVSLLQIPANRMAAARTWLAVRGYTTETAQLEMAI